jgi:uncharacterized surface anchored protein
VFTVEPGTYQLVGFSPPIGYVFEGVPAEVTVVAATTTEFSVVNASLETITISNVDETNTLLIDACFYRGDYDYACDGDDGAHDGRTKIFAAPGPLDVWQYSDSAGYEPLTQPLPIVVVAGGPNEVKFPNKLVPQVPQPTPTPVTTLVIHTVDGNGNPLTDDLAGACFVIRKPNQLACDAEDGKNDGVISMVTKTGSIGLDEIRAPLGYPPAYSSVVALEEIPTNELTVVHLLPAEEPTPSETPASTPDASTTVTPDASSTVPAGQSPTQAPDSRTPTSIAIELPSTGARPSGHTSETAGPLALAAVAIILLAFAFGTRRRRASRHQS